jgi:outer membrane protein assembly factor BamD
MIMKSMYKYALKSIPEKQEERFANALNAYNQLKDSYAKSQYLADAEKIYKDIDNKIKTIRNEHK